jgi:hypothetical protein
LSQQLLRIKDQQLRERIFKPKKPGANKLLRLDDTNYQAAKRATKFCRHWPPQKKLETRMTDALQCGGPQPCHPVTFLLPDSDLEPGHLN